MASPSFQAPSPAEEDQDGSMDTILASIRRIILEDEAGAATQSTKAAEEDDEILVLEPSMMVRPATQEQPMSHAMPPHPSGSAARTASDLAAALFDDDPIPAPAPAASIPTLPPPIPTEIMPRPTQALYDAVEAPLLAPQTRLAAAQALAALQDAAKPERPSAGIALHRSGGLTLEDMVRDELRGQLKLWLDENLPALVERIVRQEIEGLVRPA